jgi:two-component system, cell cycle response regulator
MRAQDEPLADEQVSARLAALEAENRTLQGRLATVTDQAGHNDSLLRKTRERELELLRAGSLKQLFERIIHGLRTSYQLDEVALILHDPQHEIRHLLSGDGTPVLEPPGVCFVDALTAAAPQLANLDRPWLGPYRKADHELLVPGLALPGSLALIPLRRSEQLDGVLVFSSSEPKRFTSELASDFLAHLGLVAAICVENAVNRARLLRSGFTDFLTGFHNRRYLHARLREELARAQRTRNSIACLMIDVDHFKRINDQYGHLSGDAVLREVAHRIDAEMRISDTGARFGGDEFAMVLSQGPKTNEGEKVAARLLHAVSHHPMVITEGHSETITLSIGVATATPGSGTRDYKLLAERLIAEADAALYRAKSAGRNRYAISPNVVA